MSEFVRQISSYHWYRIVWPMAFGMGVFLVALFVRSIAFHRIKRWAERTQWTWDDLMVKTMRGPVALWCVMLGIYAGIQVSSASTEIRAFSGKILTILWIVSLTLLGLKLADGVIRSYGSKWATGFPLTSLTQHVARGVILVIGALMVLNGLGISITPLLTALGIGGLAVALALQDTLSNLFAGIHILMAKQIRVGDYVKLDSGEAGYVQDISWRDTRLKNLPNHYIIIPNTKLAQSIVTNFDLPTPDLAVLVEVAVDYRSDLWKVERVTCEVAKEIMQTVPGGVPDFEPFIRYHTFGDFGIQFTAILRAKTFKDQYLIKHEFIKRLHRRYTKEGIIIPFPIRTIIQEPEGARPRPYA